VLHRRQRSHLGAHHHRTRLLRIDGQRRYHWAGRRDVAAPRRGQRLKVALFFPQKISRFASRGAVAPLVGDVLLPPPDLGVGGDNIELQTGLLEPGRWGR